MSEPLVITVDDALRHMRYCSRGMRAFAATHGLDWAAFLEHGIEAEALLATGDAMAVSLVDKVMAERGAA